MREGRLGRGRRLRSFGAALAIAVVGTAAAASPAMALPSNFWGIVPQVTPSPEQFQRLKAGGVDSVRIAISWGSVQASPGGPFDFSGADAIVASASAAGLEVLPFLYGAPTWAVPVEGRYGSPRFLPVRNAKQRSGWKEFVTQAVLRYGPRGTFWTQNPGLPRRPIRTWQIWNEPNFKYFVARPNPLEYGKLVELSYAAAKAADPGAKILLAGLFARPIEATFNRNPPQAYFATDFLQQMYAGTPGIKSKFQGVALHPYTGTYKRLVPYIEEVRQVLKENGDAGKGLWITELGWSSKPPSRGNSFAKGLQGQATQLRGAFGVLLANRLKWHLQRVYWFSVDDLKGACNFCDGSGLFAKGFKPKPAWQAFVSFTGGRVG